ncbi:hypothetical protein R6Q57_017707 [Mikania cordata]
MATFTLTASKKGNIAEHEYQASLYNGLRPESLPKHVALMFVDGATHGRLKDIARICCQLGIKVLSLNYTLSSANSDRPREKVDIARNITASDLEDLARNDIRVSFIGKRSNISESVLETIREIEERTKNNKSLHIIEAINYTGRSDIIQACIAVAEKVEKGVMQPDDIDDKIFQNELQTSCSNFPNPDLMIQMGGRFSIHNFMLWQMAYTELYFLHEDDTTQFNNTSFIQALHEYQKRSRRFGGK